MKDELLTPAPACDLRPGTVIDGRYIVGEKLGEGAVASVYLGRDTSLDQVVALKVLDPLRAADPVGRTRFEQEFAILSGLSHPGIARCLRFVQESQVEALVLEHVAGETLEQRMERGRLPVEEALEIARSIAVALVACHQAGVLHRDLKPANIVLHPERGPVVLDFGAAWFAASANLTRTGAVIGSPQYMAPEAFKSSLGDARMDLYSLGAILFEMLTGRPVRVAQGVAEIAIAHLREPTPSVSVIRPELGPDIDALVARAIATSPEHRFATAEEMVTALTTRSAGGAHGLHTRTCCAACKIPLVVDLPFCPGCGRDTSWELQPGPFAVQISDIPDEAACAGWLRRRHLSSLSSAFTLSTRLHHLPVLLAVGVSRETAEQLLAEAGEVGCQAEMVRARRILGMGLHAASATTREIAVAFGSHVLALALVIGVTGLLRLHPQWLALAPSGLGIIGVACAHRYAQRPLLRRNKTSREAQKGLAVPKVRQLLRSLTTERARRLASAAVSRAALLLVGRVVLAQDDRARIVDQLHEAVSAASDLDKHAALLQARSRSRLAMEMTQARLRADQGDAAALEKLASLEVERANLVEASLAHDLAARRALQATSAISASLSELRACSS